MGRRPTHLSPQKNKGVSRISYCYASIQINPPESKPSPFVALWYNTVAWTKRIGKFGEVNRAKILFVLFKWLKNKQTYPPSPSASIAYILPSHFLWFLRETCIPFIDYKQRVCFQVFRWQVMLEEVCSCLHKDSCAMAFLSQKLTWFKRVVLLKKPKHTRHYIKRYENNSERQQAERAQNHCDATGQLTQSHVCTPVLNL